jgi:hypothetical protein
MIKYLWQVDYPAGTRAEYLKWTAAIGADLQAPAEVRRIRSYDNALGASPNRVVEFEFESLEAAGRYFDNEKVRAVLEELLTRGARVTSSALRQRGDYTKG